MKRALFGVCILLVSFVGCSPETRRIEELAQLQADKALLLELNHMPVGEMDIATL